MNGKELVAWVSAVAGALAAIAASAGAIAAFVLVRVTNRYTQHMKEYTDHTQRMVEEMRKERVDAQRPRVVPRIEYNEVRQGIIWIENLGPGSAFSIDMTLTFEPRAARFRIQRALLRPGDRRFWNPGHSGEEEGRPQPYHADAASLPPHDTHIHLEGTCSDSLGQSHRVDERIPVLTSWEMLPRG